MYSTFLNKLEDVAKVAKDIEGSKSIQLSEVDHDLPAHLKMGIRADSHFRTIVARRVLKSLQQSRRNKREKLE